ncbi:MAG: CDP-diacylglycerol--serine O-phosphatidyltransferase [Bernardetiaceae bacterium]|nr:CDP-diacylglycerol--serine O-phosphatidyltransferase [Bernardetiaceae bacterium]
MKSHIPNLLTASNLLCGCLGILMVFKGQMTWAAYLIGIAAVFDFLDGFVARLLKVSSDIGKELDSLADCVTFGVLPAFILFAMLEPVASQIPIPYIEYIAFLIAVFSAFRLAKFNVDTRQSDSFIGVPTPANAMLIGSFPLICAYNDPAICEWIQNPYFLVGISVVMSYLLVAELPLIALKFKNFAWKANALRYIFLVLSVLLLIFFQFLGLPLIVLLYIAVSLYQNYAK